MVFIDKLYYLIRKNNIEISKLKFKNITIEEVYQILSKNCWKYGIQHEIIMKNRDILEIRLEGRKNVTLFKFHKSPMIFYDNYHRFLNLKELVEADKGIYITTGVFENSIYRNNSHYFWRNNTKIYDNYSFIKKQIRLNPKHKKGLNISYIDLSNYLPY